MGGTTSPTRRAPRRSRLLLLALGALVLTGSALASLPRASAPDPYKIAETRLHARQSLNAGQSVQTAAGSNSPHARNFTVLGHTDLGAVDTNGDVWVHGDFAYVGTWSVPCLGLGLKIIDVSDLRSPHLIGKIAARPGTSAEDVVVRAVSAPSFTGDLLATGIQRCGDDPALDTEQFGIELWDVSDPYHPERLSELGVTNGGGGVHELDLFTRGDHIYALLATPFSEWFDPAGGGDFRIVDVTDPRAPVEVGQWGAGANGFSPGPFFGIGSFGSMFGHSARVSGDGTKAYVSYWDLGVLTFDITDVTNPILLTRTRFEPDADGDAHSVSEYRSPGGRSFLFQNDEDFDPTTPTHITFRGGRGIGQNSPSGPAVWLADNHRIAADVVRAADQGCAASDYPADTAGKIAVVRTIDPIAAPVEGEVPLCLEADQEAAAAEVGAVAIVHDFISPISSPQWFDIGDVPIPVLFTDHATADGMVAAGSAMLIGRKPSWGFMRVFDAATGEQVATFDGVADVHQLPPPLGDWSIHNNENLDERSYASWYSNGIVAINLQPLDRPTPRDPVRVGQFVPPPGSSSVPFLDGRIEVWGIAVRKESDGNPTVFASDMNTGLWIVRPTGRAAP
jgi:hypothetical protein